MHAGIAVRRKTGGARAAAGRAGDGAVVEVTETTDRAIA
jgi:hypothetical protein